MKTAGARKNSKIAVVFTLAVVAAALASLFYALGLQKKFPSSDDASLEAPLVHIAPQVGGRIIALPVAENAYVHRGDLLFSLDPAGFRDMVRQAEADLALAQAALETRRRAIAAEQANAEVAAAQTRKAEENLALAQRNVTRLAPLAARAFAPAQQLDQAQVLAHDANHSLDQARDLESAARRVIGTPDEALAAVAAREAALALARRQLEHAEIRAPHDGWIAGLTVTAGEIVAPGQSLFTLIVDGEWGAVANFREFELQNIAPGACATVYSMIDRRQSIEGEVESIGRGVQTEDAINLPRTLPIVQKSLNWVRVAQRFPVRVHLHDPPPELMRRGASALVEIAHGASCR